jgi:hypothetical protein
VPKAKKLNPRQERSTIRITTPGGKAIEVDYSDRVDELKRLAMSWDYRARNRGRWQHSSAAWNELTARAGQDLNDILKVDAQKLNLLAQSDQIEVEIPWLDEEHGWEARIMPWELVATAAMAQNQGKNLPILVRCLTQPRLVAAPPPLKRISKLLLVTSFPGELGDHYSASSEVNLLTLICARQQLEPKVLPNPSPQELLRTVRDFRPEIIHLTGVDSHQGAELLTEVESGGYDGFLMRSAQAAILPVEAQLLAAILTGKIEEAELEKGPSPAALKDILERQPAWRPFLVFINTFFSASRMAALAVAHGAGNAIGFQDTIDDALAEAFVGSLYGEWVERPADLRRAFQVAVQHLRRNADAPRGSGVVLWTARSSTDPFTPMAATSASKDGLGIDGPKGFGTEPGSLSTGLGRISLAVEIRPLKSLNYALLHNEGRVFEKFNIIKADSKTLHDVEIEVSLQVGAQIYSCRQRYDLESNSTPFEKELTLPLTWFAAAAASPESVRTLLTAKVSHAGQVCALKAYRTSLQPIDEWSDTDDDRRWLPSFVLPRDPGVAKMVQTARPCLQALADDARAGFDGYQAVETHAADPGAPVDLQVRAIWWSLLAQRLLYINPPPTYVWGSQRLRSPSAVLSQGHGTCIDLTLLFAACCEYVDIYPVIFLFRGHAFPGYWRTAEAHAEFCASEPPQALLESWTLNPHKRAETSPKSRSWMISGRDERDRDIVIDAIRRQLLVPIETVALTQDLGFAVATEQGRENLASMGPQEFEFLIDVRLARRDYGVTPLPLPGDLK